MSSNSLPHRPRPGERVPSDSSSLRSQGMEIAVAPGQSAPGAAQNRPKSKELPPIPIDEYYQERTASRRSREYNAPQKFLTTSPSFENVSSRQATDTRPPSLPPKPPPVPPMTKSSHKILQLTGFDPRFEKTFPENHQQPPLSPASNSSSGSNYSQPEMIPEHDTVSRFSSWGSEPGAVTQLRGKTGEIYLKAESYSSGEKGASTHSSLSSKRPSPMSQPNDPDPMESAIPVAPRRLSPMSQPSDPDPMESAIPDAPRRPSPMSQPHDPNPMEPPAPRRPRPPLSNSSIPSTSFKYRDRSPKTLENGRVLPLTHNPNPDLEEMTTLRELLEEEHWKAESGHSDLYTQYHREFTEAELDAPVPRPLVLRSQKPKAKVPKRTSNLLTNVKQNLAVGISELTSPVNKNKHFNTPNWQATSPSKSKHPNTPVTPLTRFALDEEDEPPEGESSPLKQKRKIFGTGKHPLKSPFPFSQFVDTSESEDGEAATSTSASASTKPEGKRFSKRISGAMKRVSESTRIPPIRKTTVIRNGQRNPSGPDTPLPTKQGFTEPKQGFNDHIQEAYAEAKKKLTIKTADEKKRESLKKKIFVVGITDQSPDGRLSEWV